MDKIYLDEIRRIREEHEDTLKALSAKEITLRRFKDVLQITADEIDSLRDNKDLHPEEVMRQLNVKTANLVKRQKKMEQDIKPLRDKILELEQRAANVMTAIRSKYPDYTDDKIKQVISENL